MMAVVDIRPARPADVPGISAIYDRQVATAISTFDLEPPPAEVWLDKIGSERDGDHFLVAVGSDAVGADAVGADVVGFAYSSTYRPRPAYDRTREVSVYLDADTRGRGVGRSLYDELLARLRADGIHVALAVVAQPNPASEALHRACGFAVAGVLPHVGRKFDRWIDTAVYALRLDPAPERVAPDAPA